MLSCEDVSYWISIAQNQDIPWPKRIEVRIHVLFCTACSRWQQHVRFLDQAFRRYFENPDDFPGTRDFVPPPVLERLRTRLRDRPAEHGGERDPP